MQHKAWTLAHFFDFLVVRYQGDIHALTRHVVEQLTDELNRPAQADYGELRIPPRGAEVGELFGAWRQWLPSARKFLPAAREYLAASLWRRTGLRIQETFMLDIRDWRRDLFGLSIVGAYRYTSVIARIDYPARSTPVEHT